MQKKMKIIYSFFSTLFGVLYQIQGICANNEAKHLFFFKYLIGVIINSSIQVMAF